MPMSKDCLLNPHDIHPKNLNSAWRCLQYESSSTLPMIKSTMTEWDDNRKLPKSSQEQKSAYNVVSEKQNQHTKLGMSQKHTLHSQVAGAQARAQIWIWILLPTCLGATWTGHMTPCAHVQKEENHHMPSSRLTRVGQGCMEMTDRWGNHGSCGLPGCVRAAPRRQQKLQPQGSSLKRYFLSLYFSALKCTHFLL